MRLSEAILMNGMCKPQGFGGNSIHSYNAPCAIGGALQSVGIDNATVLCYSTFERTWPWTKTQNRCPTCSDRSDVTKIIFHLNDQHRWTRAQIAEWVASVEPKDGTQDENMSVSRGGELRDMQVSKGAYSNA